MPPENMNSSSDGSPITIRAPLRARMMSSIPCRSSVPGATRSIAASSFGSRRGSCSSGRRCTPAGVRDRSSLCLPSVFNQPLPDRLPDRFRLCLAKFATKARTARDEDFREAQLGALLQPALGLGGGAQTAGEADLGEGGERL